MTIMRGKVHKYLRMTVDYSSPGKLIFSMIDYIVKTLDNIPEGVNGLLVPPAAHHLFDIAEDAIKLSQADGDLFHHFLAQILYLLKRSCTDIQIAVSFLCTRLKGPDTYD